MRSQFTSSFQPARNLSGYRPIYASPPVAMGESVFADQRNTILRKIEDGARKMVAVRKWIASRIDHDPMLRKTFGEKYISDNFWGYDDLVVKDQYYVDLALETLGPDLEMWDLDEETLARIDEWAAVIDIMYAAMNEYGKTPLTTAGGQVVPNTTVSPGGTTTPTGGGGSIKPGTNVKDKPPGISTKDVLTYGGIGLGAIALILLLKGA